jgi:hypothetical protein
MRSRAALLALLALGLTLLGWALFARETDEEAIRRRLDTIAAAVAIAPDERVVARALRVKEALSESVARDARIAVPELGERLDRDELVGAAAQAGQRWKTGSLAWDEVEVTLHGEHAARVTAIARLDGTAGGEPRSDARPVTIDLARRDGEWIVTSLAVEPREPTEDGDAIDQGDDGD